MTPLLSVNSKILSREVKRLQGQPFSRPGPRGCRHIEACSSQVETRRLRDVTGLRHTSVEQGFNPRSLGLPMALRLKSKGVSQHAPCEMGRWVLPPSGNAHPRAKELGKTHLQPQVKGTTGDRFEMLLTLKVAFTAQAPSIHPALLFSALLTFHWTTQTQRWEMAGKWGLGQLRDRGCFIDSSLFFRKG